MFLNALSYVAIVLHLNMNSRENLNFGNQCKMHTHANEGSLPISPGFKKHKMNKKLIRAKIRQQLFFTLMHSHRKLT